MKIQVSGKQIDIGQALVVYVNERFEASVEKYFDRASSATVTFSREGADFRTDCQVNLGFGPSLRTHAVASDIHLSFDQAADRLEKRLRRYKRRLTDHRQRGKEPPLPVTSYVIAAESEDAEEPQGDAPVIVAEQVTEIPTLTVGDAVMHLDLSELNVLVFRNRAHLGVNVVYRRADGHIGWIDLSAQPAAETSQAV